MRANATTPPAVLPKQLASPQSTFLALTEGLPGRDRTTGGLFAMLLVVMAELLQTPFYERGHDEHIGGGLE